MSAMFSVDMELGPFLRTIRVYAYTTCGVLFSDGKDLPTGQPAQTMQRVQTDMADSQEETRAKMWSHQQEIARSDAAGEAIFGATVQEVSSLTRRPALALPYDAEGMFQAAEEADHSTWPICAPR